MKTIKVNSQDLGNAATIDTYATFNGDFAIDSMVDDYNDKHEVTDGRYYNYDDFEWEYNHEQIVKDLAEKRAEYLQCDVPALHSVKVLNTGSPREYNFSTDWATFEIEYDNDVVDAFIYDNPEKWSAWYRDSGWYNTIEWRDDGDKKNDLLEIARLNFYLDEWFNHSSWFDYDPLFENEMDIYYENTTMTLKGDN